MAPEIQRYRRLQVENVYLRTALEIAAIVLAIVFCAATVISSYEAVYSNATMRNTSENALQLAHSISGLLDRESSQNTEEKAGEYLSERYTKALDSCFLGEDLIYSGAIYVIRGGELSLFAASAGYKSVVEDYGLSDEATPGGLSGEFEQGLQTAATGGESVAEKSDICVAFVPVCEQGDDLPYAIAAVSVARRDSLEYDSIVKGRLIAISVVSAILIIGYYLASAFISDRGSKKQKAVNGQ